MPNPSIAVILDHSGSMGPGAWPGEPAYLPFAQTDASTFINIMNVGDFLGVVAFDDLITTVFPTTGSSAIAIAGQSTQNQAAAAIQALTARGRTNINDAIGRAIALLANVNPGGPRGMVLLSDGAANEGVTDPNKMTVPSYPMYTIALGNHGEASTMQTLASRTHGTSYVSPTPFDLATIYNDIVSQASIATPLANQQHSVPQNRFAIVPGTVPAGASSVTVTVAWGNTAVIYTPGTPTGNQVNVSLQDPSGHPVNTPAAATGPGYVVFRLPNPLAGTYEAAVWYSGTGSLGTTTGIFDPDLSLALRATFAAPTVDAGKPLQFAAEVSDHGQPVPNVRIQAVLRHPLIGSEAALVANRSLLDGVGAELAAHGGREVSDNTKMWILQSRLGPAHLLQPYGERLVPTASGAGAYCDGEIPTAVPGGHLLRLRATGTSPHSGRSFTMERCLTALVV